MIHSLPLPRTLLVTTRDGTISGEPIEEIFVREDIQKRSDEVSIAFVLSGYFSFLKLSFL